MLSPFESGWRKVRRRPVLPPLWLRRHAGPVDRFESAAADCRSLLRDWVGLESLRSLLDLGCGPGAMAIALVPDLAPEARYVGIDVHAPSIAWCRHAFARDARFRFEVVDVRSAYGQGTAPIGEYRLPAGDGETDLVIAKSLFTHLSREEAERYLSEIARVLSPGGRAMVTAFLFASAPVPAFPYGDSDVRWKRRDRPAAAMAFARARFEAMIGAAGLAIERSELGFYPGEARIPTGQDVLLLRRAGGR